MTADRREAEVIAWACRYLDPVAAPLFGSSQWVEADDRVKVAATVKAALAWFEDSDPHRLAARLDAELEAARRADEADYAGWKQIARRVRALAEEPTHHELQRRRAS